MVDANDGTSDFRNGLQGSATAGGLLDLALTARLFGSIRSASAAARLGIQNVDNVPQALARVALSPL